MIEGTLVMIAKSIIIFAVFLQLVPIVLLGDRKLMGRMQSRIGPNRVGPRVELSVADARAAGVDSGDEVRLSAGGESVTAIVAVLTGVPAGSLFLAGARLPDAPVEIVVPVVA